MIKMKIYDGFRLSEIIDFQGCGGLKKNNCTLCYNVRNVTKDPNRGYSGTTVELGTSLMLYNVRCHKHSGTCPNKGLPNYQ